jgi:UDP-N-acetylmuramyl tripeptide synthase
MRLLALWMGKITYWGLKIFGRRGSALPGLIIEKIYPAFLAKSLIKLPEGVIIITGTNGKTTSTKMLTHILKAQKRVLTNPTGSNFVRGIIAAIVHHSRPWGTLPYDIAVFELDEAYAVRFVELFKPRATIVTNIMRDQMDRFGEIDTTAKLIQKVVKNTTNFVVLNRDDARVANLSSHTKKPVFYFGVAPTLRRLYLNDDELHTDNANPQASNIPATAELLEILDDRRIALSLNGNKTVIKMTASSSFNYQNATAVCAAALAMDVAIEEIVARLQEVKPAFGRGESINIGHKKVVLQLVKNPSGFRHSLHSLSVKDVDNFMIAINDDYADGRDVSWLWDVDFKAALNNNRHRVYTSGTRAADMALRLKYDDVTVKAIEPSLERCLELALKNTKNRKQLLIYTTYTAMLYLRKVIAKNTEVETI